MDLDKKKLISEAIEASKMAYAPYSKFKVGCLIISENGNKYSGCNVENISFGLTICAERAAVSKGVSTEGSDFKINQVIIYTSTNQPITPCGACRQVLYEFGQNLEVISVCKTKEEFRMNINDLLPNSPDIPI